MIKPLILPNTTRDKGPLGVLTVILDGMTMYELYGPCNFSMRAMRSLETNLSRFEFLFQQINSNKTEHVAMEEPIVPVAVYQSNIGEKYGCYVWDDHAFVYVRGTWEEVHTFVNIRHALRFDIKE